KEKEKVTFIPSEVIELDHYVPLETNDSCLFGDIKKILIKEDLIFVMDKANKTIMIFDQTGKFKAKIDHAGNGPGEYLQINDFDVKNGLVYLYDIKSKMLIYTLNGEWITTKDMAVVFSEFSICKDGSFFISTGSQRNEFIPEIDSYSFLLGYPDSIITHKGLKRSESGNKMSILHFIDNVTRYGDTLLVIPQYSPSVYQLNPDKTIRERYRVLFEKPVTEEALEKADPEICNRDVVANGYQYLAFGWLETSEFSLFKYYFPGEDMPIQSTSCYYSKKSRSVVSYDYADNRNPAFLYYTTPKTTYQDLFVSVLPPNRIIENKSRILEKNANNPEVLRILNQLKEEDNPVLMFFRIKENCPLF
ncbi:MAG: 6-bladed beta-propeller, partial [Bacteroidales bacterium]